MNRLLQSQSYSEVPTLHKECMDMFKISLYNYFYRSNHSESDLFKHIDEGYIIHHT